MTVISLPLEIWSRLLRFSGTYEHLKVLRSSCRELCIAYESNRTAILCSVAFDEIGEALPEALTWLRGSSEILYKVEGVTEDELIDLVSWRKVVEYGEDLFSN